MKTKEGNGRKRGIAIKMVNNEKWKQKRKIEGKEVTAIKMVNNEKWKERNGREREIAITRLRVTREIKNGNKKELDWHCAK